MTRVLVAGLPRSGTTWVGQVLGRTAGARYVHEPDNHLRSPAAARAKRLLGRHPFLSPGDPAPAYEALFGAAFDGHVSRPATLALVRLAARCGAHLPPVPAGRAHAGPVVVKSVFCTGSLEWLADAFDPRVVVVERHPAAVVGSWAALGWDSFSDTDAVAVRHALEDLGAPPPAAGSPWIDRAAWHYGLLASALSRAAARHPEWLRVRHDWLCADPLRRFPALAALAGLAWGREAGAFLAASNRPGARYQTKRVWADEAVAGRSRLSAGECDRLGEVLSTFGAASGSAPMAPAPGVWRVGEGRGRVAPGGALGPGSEDGHARHSARLRLRAGEPALRGLFPTRRVR